MRKIFLLSLFIIAITFSVMNVEVRFHFPIGNPGEPCWNCDGMGIY